MFVDVNVPWPVSQAPGAAVTVLLRTLQMLQTLGYDVAAVNVVVPTIKAAKAVLATGLTDTVWEQLCTNIKGLKLLKRVTLVLDGDSPHQNVANLVEDGWDLVAVLPRTEKQLQSCASSLDIDLICIDGVARLPFVLRHKLACAAVARGVRFEVCYAGAVQGDARQCIANAANVFRATRNRGVVVSSGAVSAAGVRAPLDVVNLVTLWGLKASAARDSIGRTALAAATQGVLRTRSVKQAVMPDSDDEQGNGAKEPVKKKLRVA